MLQWRRLKLVQRVWLWGKVLRVGTLPACSNHVLDCRILDCIVVSTTCMLCSALSLILPQQQLLMAALGNLAGSHEWPEHVTCQP